MWWRELVRAIFLTLLPIFVGYVFTTFPEYIKGHQTMNVLGYIPYWQFYLALGAIGLCIWAIIFTSRGISEHKASKQKNNTNVSISLNINTDDLATMDSDRLKTVQDIIERLSKDKEK